MVSLISDLQTQAIQQLVPHVLEVSFQEPYIQYQHQHLIVDVAKRRCRVVAKYTATCGWKLRIIADVENGDRDVIYKESGVASLDHGHFNVAR